MNPETVFVVPPSRVANTSKLSIENATTYSMLSSSWSCSISSTVAPLDGESNTAQPTTWVPHAYLPGENAVSYPLLGHSDARCHTYRHIMHWSGRRRGAWCGPPRVAPTSVGRFLDIGGRDSERERLWFWQDAKCTQGCRLSTLLRRGFPFPLALLAFATRLCKLSISGLSQVIKSTNTNNRKIASGTLDTSQKLTCFLKTATCRSIHLRCGRISVFHIAIKLFKKVICRSTSCVCSVIQLVITVTSVPVNVFFVVVIVIIFTLNLHFQCEQQPRRVQTDQNYQLLLQQLQISWPWHLSLPAQHHTTVYWRLLQDAQTSSCCQCFHPQRLSCHSWPTRMQTRSKSDQTFQPAKYFECFRAENPLISAFEAFSAWPTFDYCKVNRRVQCLMVSP